MFSRNLHVPFVTLAAALIVACCASATSAQSMSPEQRADRLFSKGKALLKAGEHARACALLEESFKVEPATGALLALAVCREQQGMLASAFRAYNAAAERSRYEQRADREQAARDRAAALEPKLSRLTVAIEAKNLSGVEVRVDGSPIDRALFGWGMPVDGGEHAIEVTARDKRPWRARVSVAPSGESKTVIVAALEDVAPPEPVREARLPEPEPEADESSGPSAVQWLGIGSMVVGLGGLGVGTYFTLEAVERNEDSKSAGCDGDVCTESGWRARQDALKAGDVATIALAAGGGLAVTGLVLYFTGGSGSDSDSESAALAAGPWADGQTAGATLSGSF